MFSVIAILALVVPRLSGAYVPPSMVASLGLDVVDRILAILASSMLAVAIFSLTTMVAAIQAASQAATPRIRALLAEDRTAQTTISIFIGTFLFSLAGLIGLSSGLYTDAATVVLFVLTILIIVTVVVALIRWIQKLSTIGGVSEAISRAEAATRGAFATVAAASNYGGRAAESPPEDGEAISAKRIGYVQHVDGDRVAKLSETLGTEIHLMARPGTYVDPTRPLAYTASGIDDQASDSVRNTFVVGRDRAFESDPSFGLVVLSEIAARALSPAVNDPGTAIDVIGTQTRLLEEWGAMVADREPEVRYPKLTVAPMDPDMLIDDAFAAMARDGAHMIEVQLRLQKSLATLAATHPTMFREPARRLSRIAVERAKDAMSHVSDVEKLEAAAAAVGREDVADRSANAGATS